ncbi:Scr1 family TA system antitoxin-like transcriptional regulator, partial [Streptomyces sp. DSM 41524]|nr:Scr1 family TA system antitoxin-like transcriptional regulator [Streptomyces sp. DSM 41524]
VMAAQLDRLAGLIGLDTVELGVIPLGAQLRRAPSHGFWIYDRRRVIVETINTEMWLDDEENIALYERAWDWMAEAAVHGSQARRLIGRARASMEPL